VHARRLRRHPFICSAYIGGSVAGALATPGFSSSSTPRRAQRDAAARKDDLVVDAAALLSPCLAVDA